MIDTNRKDVVQDEFGLTKRIWGGSVIWQDVNIILVVSKKDLEARRTWFKKGFRNPFLTKWIGGGDFFRM